VAAGAGEAGGAGEGVDAGIGAGVGVEVAGVDGGSAIGVLVNVALGGMYVGGGVKVAVAAGKLGVAIVGVALQAAPLTKSIAKRPAQTCARKSAEKSRPLTCLKRLARGCK
jgi:hypothetical protein